jgi:hypothetical protein
MIEKGSEEDTPSSKSFSPGAKWWEVVIDYLPTLLKLLASLGLLRTLTNRQRVASSKFRGNSGPDVGHTPRSSKKGSWV